MHSRSGHADFERVSTGPALAPVSAGADYKGVGEHAGVDGERNVAQSV
jgi:hypothetical protein